MQLAELAILILRAHSTAWLNISARAIYLLFARAVAANGIPCPPRQVGSKALRK